MTVQDILTKVASKEISAEEGSKLIASLSKGNGNGQGKITYKVSEKGAVSAYGLGRFPVTLYAEQWERLDSEDERKRRQQFLKDHAKELTRKG